MIHDDFVIILLIILYSVIGGFMVIDAWFDFELSSRIRKFFGIKR